MKQISNTVNTNKKYFNVSRLTEVLGIFMPVRVSYAVLRPVVAIALILAVTSSGWIASVGATQNCLPGDICYGVKLATEKTQEIVMAVTGSNESKTKLQLEFASRRAKEVKTVMKNNDAGTTKNATEAIKHLQDAMVSANTSMQDASQSSPEKMVAFTKDVNDKTNQIVITLKEAEKSTSSTDLSLSKELVDAKKTVNDTGIKAIEVVLEKQAQGEVSVNNQEVKNMVQQTLNSIANDSNSIKTETEQFKNITKDMQAVIKTITASSSFMSGTSSVSNLTTNTLSTTTLLIFTSTTEAVKTVSSTMNQVNQAVEKADQTSQTMDANLQAVKTLLDNNKLMEAVQKVKSVNEMTTDVQKTVVEVKNTVQQVLPEVKLPTATTTVATTTGR